MIEKAERLKYTGDPVLLAQKLMQFNTTNGQYPEGPMIHFIKDLLDGEGIETSLVYRDPQRPNLWAVIQGTFSEIPPLLLYGHGDTVSVDGQNWSVPPFEGIIRDGYLWGRGAIDMKGQLAMFLCTFFYIKQNNIRLPFDLKLLVVSDEEGDSDYGMKYLVEEHASLFQGISYALGEIGGFSFAIAGKSFYPVMIAEKQFAHLRITTESKGGHASFSQKKTSMEKMAQVITTLSESRLPVRITPSVSEMIKGMACGLGGVQGAVLKLLLKPSLTNRILKVLGSSGELFDPLLHNSLNVTMVKGGTAINVIPSEVSCEADLRLVPGCSIEDALADIKAVIGQEVKLEVLAYDKGGGKSDMKLFESLAHTLKKQDQEAIPVPFVLSAVTDGRFLSRAGVQTYGFTPMKLPEDYDFISMAHNGDERIPVEALSFGVSTLIEYIVQDYKEVF